MKITRNQLRSIIKEAIDRSEEDGEGFELDVRHYKLKDQAGRPTVGYPKRYADNMKLRRRYRTVVGDTPEERMGVYLHNDVRDKKIKSSEELEAAIDELALYYSKPDRAIDKEKIRAHFEESQKSSRELDARSRRPHAGLTTGTDSDMWKAIYGEQPKGIK